ncbi:MAG: hypothetical protein ACRDU8_05465, partial [Egibacteraceae bacterium]
RTGEPPAANEAAAAVTSVFAQRVASGEQLQGAADVGLRHESGRLTGPAGAVFSDDEVTAAQLCVGVAAPDAVDATRRGDRFEVREDAALRDAQTVLCSDPVSRP